MSSEASRALWRGQPSVPSLPPTPVSSTPSAPADPIVLPCPFCGEQPGFNKRRSFVGCNNSDCPMGTASYVTLELWNTRAPIRAGDVTRLTPHSTTVNNGTCSPETAAHESTVAASPAGEA